MSADWEKFLAENPKVLWGLVADVVKAVKASSGERKTGRRPAASCDSIDELYQVLFPPAYSLQPFSTALEHLLRDKHVSQRDLAAAVHVNQSTISRIMAGNTVDSRWRQPLTVEFMEAVAVAMDVRPHYFAEYRAMKLGQLVTDVLLDHPSVSAVSLRRMSLSGAPA